MASQGSLPIPCLPRRQAAISVWAIQMLGLRKEAGLCLFVCFLNDFLFYFFIVLVIHEHMLILKNLNNTILEHSKDCRKC